MKRAAITGQRRAELVEAPTPKPVGRWALVKVIVAPMCTEYKAFIAGGRHDYLGHEAVGEVVAVDQPGTVKPGDRVVVMPQYPCGECALCVAGDYIHCQHTPDFVSVAGSREGSATMAQYLLKPDWILPKIPDGVSYEHASLALCGLGPSFGAFDAMNLSASDTVLITGLGAVGLGAVANADFHHARIIAVESIPYRAERARLLGAEFVLDPRDPGTLPRIMELTGGLGVDCALDCSGVVAAERLCIDAARRKGKVAFIGECNDSLPISVSPDMIRKGLTVIGSWHYNLNLYPKVMNVIQRSPVIDHLVSHIYPMSCIQEAFETSAGHDCAKILLRPWE